ncbi:MAG: glycosyltransferase family 39 protein [Dokdonella sp.]
MTAKERRDFWLFMAFAFVVLAVGIGLRAPWPSDEPRFVLVAKQMWESGDWLFPHRGRELYPDKPPVYFWLLNASYAVIRNWTWAFLLPSLLAALGTLALTIDLGRRLWNPRVGLWAGAAVLCAVQFVYQSKRAQIDPTVVFLITLGCYGILRHSLLGPNWRWYWVGCFAAGLGVATKGVGFLALLILIPFALMRWRKWRGLTPPERASTWHWTLGAIAFLGGIAIWFVPMLSVALADGDPAHRAYLDNILFKQTATRYTNAWHHHEPFWYFGEVIVLFWMPLSLALPWLVAPWRNAWRERDAKIWLPLAWVLLVLLFFSASPGKRDMYILPALPMLALAAAPFLDRLTQRRGLRIALLGFVIVLGAAFLGIGLAALLGNPSFELKLEMARGLADGGAAEPIWISVLIIGVLMLAAAAWSRLRHVIAALAIATLVLWTGYGVGIAPALDAESSSRRLMEDARTAAGSTATIGLIHWTEQMLLQAIGPTTEFGFRADVVDQWNEGLQWMRASPSDRWVLVQAASLPTCVASPKKVGIANRREWFLVDTAAAWACSIPIAEADLPANAQDE